MEFGEDSPAIEKLADWLDRDVDLVLVNPPFGGVDRPSLALHLLQAIASEEGLKVKVLYANLILAGWMGERAYQDICYASSGAMLGERFFSSVAYGNAPLMGGTSATSTHIRTLRTQRDFSRLEWVHGSAETARGWVETVADLIGQSGCKAVGLTTTFEQTAASIALAHRISAMRSDVILLIGGANCEGDMAGGLESLSSVFDVIFSGESEATFRQWCRIFMTQRENCTTPVKGDTEILNGAPCTDLDALPPINYDDYYFQLAACLPDSELVLSDAVWLTFETSRGCWWGQKHHCTFCGINGEGMTFRQKSAKIAFDDLVRLSQNHPNNRVMMVDNIMPHTYFNDLLPLLAARENKFHIFYEQKANLDFRRMSLLKNAGIEVIQAGIEALSTPLLAHMKKGVKASQNITLLRLAVIHDIFINWNLLHSFPGDISEWYEDTINLLPWLFHLYPPTAVSGLSIDRFSPYFDRPRDFAIQDMSPLPSYFDVLPKGVEVDRIAYHFEGNYKSGSRENPGVIQQMEGLALRWRDAWQPESGQPRCHIVAFDVDNFLLVDTRPGVDDRYRVISRPEAAVALVGPQGLAFVPNNLRDDLTQWSIHEHLCVEIDSTVLPLATASLETFLEFAV